MKRPVVIILLAVILGECTAITDMWTKLRTFAKTGWPIVFLVLMIVGVIFALIGKKMVLDYSEKDKKITTKRICFIVVIFLFGLTGYCRTSHQISLYNKVDKWTAESVLKGEGRFVNCQETQYGFNLKLDKVVLQCEGECIINCSVIIQMTEQPKLRSGNIVCFNGIYKPIAPEYNIGNFDAKTYYHSNGICAFVKVKTINDIAIKSYNYNLFGECATLLRNKINNGYDDICCGGRGLMQLCDSEKAGIFKAITLGDKSELADDIKQLYRDNGISHVLAISGLHISTIGIFIYKLMRRRFKFIVSGVAGIVCVSFFVMMSGGGVSAIRAAGMFGFYLATQMLGRKYDMVNSMAFVALYTMLLNPFILLNSAFLMSFGAIIAVACVKPVIENVLLGKDRGKPHNREEIFKQKYMKSKVKLYLDNIRMSVVEGMLISLSIELVLMPVMAYNYFELPAYSLILNIVIIPMMALVIGPALWAAIIYIIGGMFGLKCCVISRYIILISSVVLEVYRVLCEAFLSLPGNLILIGRPGTINIVIYYILLLGFILFVKLNLCKNGNEESKGKVTDNEKRSDRLFLRLRQGLFAVFVVCLVWVLSCVNKPELEIMINSVGQGECIVIRNSEVTYMVDCGSTDIGEIADKRVISTLKAQRIKEIDYLFITHGDNDHISGIMEMIEREDEFGIRINNLVMSMEIPKDDAYIKIVELAKAHETGVLYLEEDDCLSVGELKVRSLYPKKDTVCLDRNESSLILDVEYGQFTMLLTGDAPSSIEEEFIGKLRNEYTILKVAHHGSGESTSDEFLSKTNPLIGVISCGIDNSYGHPHKELMERLNNHNVKIYRTDELGQIIINADSKGNIKIKSACSE